MRRVRDEDVLDEHLQVELQFWPDLMPRRSTKYLHSGWLKAEAVAARPPPLLSFDVPETPD